MAVPGAPTGLVTNPSTTNSDSLVLSWTAPSSNGGFAILDYLVEYHVGDNLWVTGAVSVSTSATINGLTSGVQHSVRVRARNQDGYSNAVTDTETPIGLPNPVTNLVVSASSSSSFTFTWTNNATAAAPYTRIDYTLRTSEGTEAAGGTLQDNATSKTFTVSADNLVSGVEYTLYVLPQNYVSLNKGGLFSTTTTSPLVVSRVAPLLVLAVAPSNIVATAGQNEVSLSWTAVTNAKYYVVTISPSVSFKNTTVSSVVAANNNITIGFLTENIEYSFTVATHNGTGLGSASSPVTATPTAGGTAAVTETYAGITGVTNFGLVTNEDSNRLIAADNVHSLELNGRLPINDEVFCAGNHVFLSRNQRWYVMTRLDSGENVWSELVFPIFYSYQPFAPKHMCELNGNVYFIGELGTVWRMEMGESENQLFANKRGTISYNEPYYPSTLSPSIANYSVNNTPTGWAINYYHEGLESPTLTLSTPTLAGDDIVTKSFWHRVAMRVRRPFSNVESYGFVSKLVRMITSDKPGIELSMEEYWLQDGAPVQYVTNKDQDIFDRTEVVVPAHGPSVEFSATAEFQGDVIVEGVTVYKHGRTPRRK